MTTFVPAVLPFPNPPDAPIAPPGNTWRNLSVDEILANLTVAQKNVEDCPPPEDGPNSGETAKMWDAVHYVRSGLEAAAKLNGATLVQIQRAMGIVP